MPSWGIHLEIANKLAKKLNLEGMDKNNFIFGNILPDINNGYVIPNVKIVIPHEMTHFSEKRDNNPTYINFYKKYKDKLDNKVILGYFVHVVSDLYFNNMTYTEYGIYDSSGNRIGLRLNDGTEMIGDGEQRRATKTNDFKIFADYIYNNSNLENLKYNDEIIKSLKVIEEIDVNEQDMKNAIEYINKCINKEISVSPEESNATYKVFSEEDLKKRTDICIDFILGQI